MSKVVIIGLSGVENIGLEYLLHNIPGAEDSAPECFIFDCIDRGNDIFDKADCLIASADIFAGNIGFFMPRKSRTLVVCRDLTGRQSGLSDDGAAGFGVIYHDTDPETITQRLSAILCLPANNSETSSALSAREKEVLHQLASGKTNKEIADILSISVNTVITHRKNISSKLGIKSVSGLSLYALMNGVI